MGDFTRFGGDLLSQGLSPSTIGAAALNFRVRDGTGCFACAMTTKPRKIPTSTFLRSKKATRGRQRIRESNARCRTVLFSINAVQSAFADCHARQAAYSFTNARCRNLAVLGQGRCMLLV